MCDDLNFRFAVLNILKSVFNWFEVSFQILNFRGQSLDFLIKTLFQRIILNLNILNRRLLNHFICYSHILLHSLFKSFNLIIYVLKSLFNFILSHIIRLWELLIDCLQTFCFNLCNGQRGFKLRFKFVNLWWEIFWGLLYGFFMCFWILFDLLVLVFNLRS